MTQAFSLGIVGLSSGSLIALAALGIVLVYRGSGIINFANGVIGTLTSFLYWDLHVNHSWPQAPAVIVSLAAAALVGFLIHQGVLRPMRNASALTRTIATLAVLVIVESALSLKYGANARVVQAMFPTKTFSVLGARIGYDHVILLIIAIVLTVALSVVYGRSKFGLATAACAENGRAAGALGINPDSVARTNWLVGSMLAGISGILLAPIVGVQIVTQTELIIPALAAALVGGMGSFGFTLLGGLFIGVAQAEITRYVSAPGWSDAVPFLIILVLMAVRGRGIPVRSKLREIQPAIGRVTTNVLQRALTVAFMIVLLEWVLHADYVTAAAITFSYGLILLSSVVVTGYTGQLSLCQFSFAGVGAVIAGRLVASDHVTWVLAALIAMVAAFPIGILLGLPVLRTRGVNLAVATLGLAVAVQSIVLQNTHYTGGQFLTVPEPTVFGYHVGELDHGGRWALVCLVAFVLTALIVGNLRRGQAGRRLLAVRANERAAQSLGINPYEVKLFAFALSASIAALGGVLVVYNQTVLEFDQGFDPFSSINGLVYSVLGGIGYLTGPLVGGLGQPGGVIPTIFQAQSANFPYWIAIVGGVLTIRTLQVKPDGAVALVKEQVAWFRRLIHFPARNRARRPLDLSAMDTTPQRVQPRTLQATGMSVSYGGVLAVDSVDLEVGPGEILGVIGPNGAGKTSLIDALTGGTRASRGQVTIGDRRVERDSMHRRVRFGIGRSFQSLELFDDMTVEENIRAAVDSHRKSRYFKDLIWPREPALPSGALGAISVFGLSGDLGKLPTDLPYSRRRLVGIARAVAALPSVLCLDEPAAGLSTSESQELGRLLRHLADDFGMGIVLVEHDVELIMSTCDRVTAIEFGRVIASGSPSAVRSDPAVVRAYLGTEEVGVGPGASNQPQSEV